MTKDDHVDLDRFDHDDAWELGCQLVGEARRRNLPVVISIHIGEQRVFHAGLPGSSAMNDSWVDRKRNTVRHFDRSTLAVWERYAEGNPDFYTAFGLPLASFAAGEGAIPLRVGSTQIGVLSVSGMEPTGDHEFIVEGAKQFAAERSRSRQGDAPDPG